MNTDLEWLTARPIAHRGLHDRSKGRPENSMAAFRAAVERNYAIECDLQISADKVPMVFHDATLDRTSHATGRIRATRAADLTGIRLKDCDETIPTLADLLTDIRGRVPLILELKSIPGEDEGFPEAVAAVIAAYTGPLALMSFNSVILGPLRQITRGRPVGLVAEGGSLRFLTHFRALWRERPNFLSYDIDDLPNPLTIYARRILKMPVICWTVITDDQRWKAARWTDQITFEGFEA